MPDYQGQGNWYYLSGDFAANRFSAMFFRQAAGWWQGASSACLIDDQNIQYPQGGADAIRAYRAPQGGQLSVSGAATLSGDPADITVTVVRRPDELLSVNTGDETLFSADLSASRESADVEIKSVEVKAGDVLFFVAHSANAAAWSGVKIDAAVNIRITKAPAAMSAWELPPFDLETGFFAITTAADNGMRQPEIISSMSVNNTGGCQYMVQGKKESGFTVLPPPVIGGGGDENVTYDGGKGSVYIAWRNHFCSNAFDLFTGVQYRVPADGLLSIVGKAYDADSTHGFEVLRKRGEAFSTLYSVSHDGSLKSFAAVAEINQVEVEAGDEIYWVATSEGAWGEQEATFYFDFRADALTESVSTMNYLDYFATYQGGYNWYYLGGDFSSGAFTNMIYAQNGKLWQGETDDSAITADLVQSAGPGGDSARAYVIPKTGEITLSGTVRNYCSRADELTAKIVLRPGDGGADRTLFEEAFKKGSFHTALSNYGDCSNISVEAGDTLFFVATGTGKAAFEVVPVWINSRDGDVPVRNFTSARWSMDDVEAAPNNQMMITNYMGRAIDAKYHDGPYMYLDYNATADSFAPMEYAGGQETKYVRQEGTMVVWGTQFYSNVNGDGNFAAIGFGIQADGAVSVLGKVAGPSTTGYKIMLKTGGGHVTLLEGANDNITTAFSLSSAAALQDVAVEAGDEIYFIFTSTNVWNPGSAVVLFDFIAEPTDGVAVPSTDLRVSDSQYGLTFAVEQEQSGWRYLSGNSSALADAQRMRYIVGAEDVWSGDGGTISVDEVVPKSGGAVFLGWQAPADGSGTVRGFIAPLEMFGAPSVKIVRIARGDGSYGGSATIFDASLSGRQDFADGMFIDIEFEIGDLLYFAFSGDAANYKVYVDYTPLPFASLPGAPPAADPVPYSPGLTLAGVALPAGYSWFEPGTPLAVADSGLPFAAIYAPAGGNAGFSRVPAQITVTVNKGAPAFTVPVLEPVQYGEGLTLAGVELPEGFAWKDPDTAVEAGTRKYAAVFTPSDRNNFEVAELEIELTVTGGEKGGCGGCNKSPSAILPLVVLLAGIAFLKRKF
jgi:hypothetical protein